MAREAEITALTPDPKNLRVHDERNKQVIRESIERFGVNRPIVMDENGVVLAGNGVLEAAKELGITRVRVVEVDGNELVAVQVSHLDDDAKRQYAVADNRAGELSTFDPDALRTAIEEEGLDVEGYFFHDELVAMLGPIFESAEERTEYEAANERVLERGREIDALMETVVCPYCYHVWSPEAEEGDDDATGDD